MTRWTHGHSFAVGVAGGLVLDRHVFVIFLAGVALGAAAAVLAKFLRAAKQVVLERGRELHDEAVRRMKAETFRKEMAAREAESKADHRIRTRTEQDKEIERAYIQGVADGAHS